jgi:hypothetical protein
MRGFAISFLTLEQVALAGPFLPFSFAIHPS